MTTPQLPEDQYLEIDSLNIRYWALGNHPTPLILVHGLGGYAENWMFNMHALAEHFRVYVLDLPGFGKSDKPDAPFTYMYFARFVHRFMETLHIERAHFTGHSLGGGMMLKLALTHPEKISKLVLVGSSGLGRAISPSLRLLSLPLIGEKLSRPSPKGIARLYKQMVNDKSLITADKVELGYQINARPRAQRTFLATARNMMNLLGMKPAQYKPIRTQLHKVKAPVLVLWGQQDRMVPVKHARVAEENIPDVSVKRFDKCGHLPMMEHPEAFNQEVVKFLEDSP